MNIANGWVRRAFRLALGAGLALTFVLAQWSMAEAHALLLAASPAPNGYFTADQPPIQVQLTFSEEVVPAFSTIRVLNEAGETLTDGNLSTTNSERTNLVLALPSLASGTYTVAWSVVSAVDGHTSSGSYGFGVGVVPTAQASTNLPAVSVTGVVSRWLGLTGQILLLGVFVFYLFVWRMARRAVLAVPDRPADDLVQNGEPLLDRSQARQGLRVGWIGIGLVVAGLVLALVGQPTIFSVSSAAQLLGNLQVWFVARYGAIWTNRLLLCAALGFTLANLGWHLNVENGRSRGEQHYGSRSWMWWAGLALAVVLSLTATFSSHSAALPENGLLAVISDGAHALAAGAWVGGLVQLVLATRLARRLSLPAQGELNRKLVLNFSTMAAISVGMLLMSGGFLAWQHIGTWEALFETPYGQALLAKVGLAVPALATAGINLLIVRPRLEGAQSLPETGQATLHRRFGRLVWIEAGFTLAVIAAAGLLTNVQPGRDALRLAQQAGATASMPADDLNVTLTIEPGQWGQNNSFDIQLLDGWRRPVLNASDVSLRFTFIDRPLGTNVVSADPVGNGHFRATGAILTLGGTWQAEVAIRRPDAYDAFAAFRLDTTAQGTIHFLNSSSWTARLIDWLNTGGRWAVALALVLGALAWATAQVAIIAAGGRLRPALVVTWLPSLLAMTVAVQIVVRAVSGTPGVPSGDPRALALLAQSEAAMNRLASVQLLRTTRGDSGAVLTETVSFQAPGSSDDRMSNGVEYLAQGVMRFQRGTQDQQWQVIQQTEPYLFPDFNFSQQAVDAKLGRQETVDGRPAQQVVFTIYLLRNPIPYSRWIDVDTKLILHETMDAPGHHMLSIYHAFNEPVTIVLPSVTDIGPTPTVTP